MITTELSCIDCAVNNCEQSDATHPAFCPASTFDLTSNPMLQQQMAEEQNRRIIDAAAFSAHVGHRETLSHLEETVVFAQKFGAKRIGIAACISLAAESRAAAKVFRAQGFDVVGAICKVGCITFGELDVEPDERGPEAVLCNPLYQAQLLNEAQTDLNVVIGLCTGHDALFLKHANAPCTVLTAKDFKFDHCSIRALRPDDESGDFTHLINDKVDWS